MSTQSKAPLVLLVNPWITDFAAFDLWAKPIGLLTLASLLRRGGCGVAFLDCLDRFDSLTNDHPQVFRGTERKYGTGKYPTMLLAKPAVYSGMPRNYYRYGIHPESFEEQVRAIPKPDLIWVTSMMTYWYPGVHETIGLLRRLLPDVPLWLGGIYARLCPSHAQEKSGATEIVTLPVERLPALIEAATGFAVRNKGEWSGLQDSPSPALEYIRRLTYIPVMTSVGCPFVCPYCASHLLQPKWVKRRSYAIYQEISGAVRKFGVLDFAFYDDALLLGSEAGLMPVLERIRREGLKVRFHTPNALHIRALTAEWCSLLFESGFTTIRMGLETIQTDKQREWGGKAETQMFISAVRRLLAAGFKREQIGVYLLCGLPEQSPAEVVEAIQVVHEAGAQPYLAEYSPIPGTAMWPKARLLSDYDIENEPLYHNNTFYACRRSGFSFEDLQYLKDLARRARR